MRTKNLSSMPSNLPAGAVGLSLPRPNLLQAQRVNTTAQSTPLVDSLGKKVNGEFAVSIYDAFFRALIRWYESVSLNSSLLRIPFRGISEVARYTSGGVLKDLFDKGKINKKAIFASSARRALENTIATTVIEPNRFENRALRMVVGFANMVVRVTSRLLLGALDIISPDELEIESIGDEFVSRSLLRGIYMQSDNPLIGIGVRTAEQLGINELLRYTPFKNLLSKVSKKQNYKQREGTATQVVVA